MKPPESGQATVEFALMLPLVVLAAWMPLAAGSLAVARLEVAAAARNAAREAAMSVRPEATARRVATAGTDLRPVRVTTEVRDGLLRVAVTATFRLPLPVPGALNPEIILGAEAAVSSETLLDPEPATSDFSS